MSESHTIASVEAVKFKGHVRDGNNLSAAGLVGDLLLVAGDEDDRLQILRRNGQHYELLPERTVVLNSEGQEADIEGIACDGNTIYAVGSHSCARPKPKASAAREQNRERFASPKPASLFRSIIARFQLSADGSSSIPDLATLRPLLDATQVLRPFAAIPCKENGIDIEGLAVRDGRLFVGFRGPVFQHGLVPVLTCSFPDAPAVAELLYLNLGGRGVRDLERVRNGFLVLAGPVSDIAAGFELYFWDGGDCMPGASVPTSRLELLGPVPTPEGAKAEGLAVENESDDEYVVLVLFDGLKEGGAVRFRVRKPT